MVGFAGREELRSTWEGVLGQLGFGWERTLEPWRRQHKAISLLDSSFKRQQGFIAINSCFHLMAVVWPICAVNSRPPRFTVPSANFQCWSQTVKELHRTNFLLCSRSLP